METQLKMVELLPHDGGWKHAFKIERDIILSVIDKNVLGVEHVGSTSVVNIKAKAIVDIVVGLDSLKNGHIYI